MPTHFANQHYKLIALISKIYITPKFNSINFHFDNDASHCLENLIRKLSIQVGVKLPEYD